MRRTAIVTSSQPDASTASRITSKEGYLPVPVISRERNSRPAMTSGSEIVAPFAGMTQIRFSGRGLVAASQSPSGTPDFHKHCSARPYPDAGMPYGTATFLLSGPSAAGKTTVARLLAQRFPRGVHVEGDVFRRCVVAGRAEMTPEPSREALTQLRLRYRLAALVADTYFDAGFAVVLEDVIAGPLLEECSGLIRSRPLHVVVLLPTLQAVSLREHRGRIRAMRTGQSRSFMMRSRRSTPRIGHWLDNSGQSPEQTVQEILRLLTWSRRGYRRPHGCVPAHR